MDLDEVANSDIFVSGTERVYTCSGNTAGIFWVNTGNNSCLLLKSKLSLDNIIFPYIYCCSHIINYGHS